MTAKSKEILVSPVVLPPEISAQPQISRAVPILIPAGVSNNGQISPGEQSITQAGTRFYVLAASAPVTIQPIQAQNIGASNSFGIGQGQTVRHGFISITCKNYSLTPIAALIWVGFEDFINDQLILASTSNPNVVYPTYPTTNAATFVDIVDKSGTAFQDINGGKWYAISRVAILITNLDGATVLNVQKLGSRIQNGVSIDCVQPLQTHRLDISGGYTLCIGGAPVNAFVSEIYQAIPSS